MTVLHIITGLAVGGAEQALYNLLAGGLTDSDKHVVLSLGDERPYGRHIRALGVPVETLGMRKGMPGPTAILGLRRCVRRWQPDVIQGWMYHGNLAAWLAQRVAPGKPPLAWAVHHSLYELSQEKALTRWVIRANSRLSGVPDSLIYVSRLSRRQHEEFGFCSSRAQAITVGFDLMRFQPDIKARRALRAAVDVPDSAVVIGHVARLHPMKDHARFVRAVVRALDVRPDIHVLLIGRGVTPANAALSALVPEKLKKHFHWLGERDDIPELMRTMDIFCQSSWSEAFPNVLGEAMATGVPCVTTNVGDSAYIVGDTGIVVPPSDDDALFHGMMEMLSRSVEARQALGRVARTRIEANFGLDAVDAQYADLYHRLTEGEGCS